MSEPLTRGIAVTDSAATAPRKTSADAAARRKAEAVAKQFEGLLVAAMFREMRGGTQLFAGADPSAGMFDTFFDQALAEQAGLGNYALRKMILDATERTQHHTQKPSEMPEQVKRWDPMIERIAKEEKVDSNLVRAVMAQESGGNPHAVSRAGARGLMQLMPATADTLGIRQIHDPEENIRGGARYLRMQLDRFGQLDLALAAYNAGPDAVTHHRGIPPYRETRDYVTAVKARLQQQGLSNQEGKRDE